MGNSIHGNVVLCPLKCDLDSPVRKNALVWSCGQKIYVHFHLYFLSNYKLPSRRMVEYIIIVHLKHKAK
jgi:hypothetical protein